ncbi:MAG: type II secretion system protein [Planctomycetota bacterium]
MPSQRRYCCRSGFSLPELTIVVLIIGILAVATVPKLFDSVDYFHADAAAKRIKQDLEMARRRARSKGTAQSVAFVSSTSTYSLPNVPDLDRSGANYAVDLTRAPYSCLLINVNFNGTETVTFDGYGVPNQPGKIGLKAGTYAQTITIEATTGKVTIQ